MNALLAILAIASILGGSALAVADVELAGGLLILLGCAFVAVGAHLGSRTARAARSAIERDPG